MDNSGRGVPKIFFSLFDYFISFLMGQTVNESQNFLLEAVRENKAVIGTYPIHSFCKGSKEQPYLIYFLLLSSREAAWVFAIL